MGEQNYGNMLQAIVSFYHCAEVTARHHTALRTCDKNIGRFGLQDIQGLLRRGYDHDLIAIAFQ